MTAMDKAVIADKAETNPVHQLLTDNIDLWTSAIEQKKSTGRGSNRKQHLYGIKKLRELILELAVRGKLVPQDPNDEPASELLKRIAAERDQLVKDKKIKKPKKLPEITEEEKLFELPNGWEWVRLGAIINLVSGQHLKPSEYSEEYLESSLPYITGPAEFGAINPVYSKFTLERRAVACTDDILITCKGSGIGKTNIAGCDIAISRQLMAINALDVDNAFLKLLVDSLYDYFQGKGVGIAIPGISRDDITRVIIMLPPLEEQLRIVAKVDELMALCDQLEQQTEQQLDAHQCLVDTLLDTLVQSQNAQELADNWARLSDHFDTLFTTEASIDQLKQTILQLAVMGKLVPQNPDDEPASELLKRIAEEKAQLIKEKKIKKQKALPPISDKEKPFELPEGWEWSYFDDVVDIQSGITKGRKLSGRDTRTVKYLSVANVQRGFIDLGTVKEVEIPVEETDKYQVFPKDLLITEGGDWDKVGRTAIWPDITEYMAHQNHVFKARIICDDQNEIWLEKFLNSAVARDYFAGSSKQTTNLASINKTQLRGCLVAVPPHKEQSRIVAKVNNLFALCDQLKARVQQTQRTQLLLTDTLVQEALS